MYLSQIQHGLVLPGRARVQIVCSSSRGFGKGTQQCAKDVPVDGSSGRKVKIQRSKGKQSMRVGPGRLAPPQTQQQQQQEQQMMRAPPGDGADSESLTTKLEFESRLKALKAASDEKRAETRAAAASGAGSILDGPQYDNPPPLTQTLFGGDSKSATETEPSTFGPSQVGLAVASLALIAVFVLANGGSELGYATRRSAPASGPTAAVELAPEQRADLEAQLATVSQRLEAAPADLEALESAAVLHVRLGDYAAAEKQLAELTAATPGNADAWRVLAETRGASGNVAGAVAAYRKAWEGGGRSSLEVLTGLTSALAADGKAQAAVDELRTLASTPALSAKIGEVEVGLLLGKAYSQWRGHAADALTQYDSLAEAHPDDFRPPLAKGLLLRREGREGDAQRYLLQARYLAPGSSKAAVAALAGE